MATGIYSGQKRRGRFDVEVSVWTFRRGRFGAEVSALSFGQRQIVWFGKRHIVMLGNDTVVTVPCLKTTHCPVWERHIVLSGHDTLCCLQTALSSVETTQSVE